MRQLMIINSIRLFLLSCLVVSLLHPFGCVSASEDGLASVLYPTTPPPPPVTKKLGNDFSECVKKGRVGNGYIVQEYRSVLNDGFGRNVDDTKPTMKIIDENERRQQKIPFCSEVMDITSFNEGQRTLQQDDGTNDGKLLILS